MSIILRRQIPTVLSLIIFGVLLFSTLISGEPTIAFLGLEFTKWSSIVSGMSVGLGIISLCIYHIPRIIRFENEPQLQWLYSISSLFFMFAFIITGLWFGNGSAQYAWWYDTFNAPIAGAAPFLSGFFIVPATYRSFKLKNWDSAALIIPAVIFIIYQTPMFSGLPILSTVALWLLAYVTAATFRACIVIIGLGIIYLSLRTILGMEKGFLHEAS
jgi:hypothetical protein